MVADVLAALAGVVGVLALVDPPAVAVAAAFLPWAPKSLFGSGRQAQSPKPFESEGTTPEFYCPEAILQDPEAMEELQTSLKSITSTGDQWWEDALGCIQKKAFGYQREHRLASKRSKTTGYATVACFHEGIGDSGSVLVPLITGKSSNGGSNSLHPPSRGV